MKKYFNTKRIATSGLIGALYVVLSLFTYPISSGAIQVRIAEGLTILPLFFPEAIVGVFIGCLLSNVICGCAVFDIIFGSLITLLSASLTYIIGRRVKQRKFRFLVGGCFPVLLNAIFLPLIWLLYTNLEYVYILQVGLIFAGQFLSVYGLGAIIYKATEKIFFG